MAAQMRNSVLGEQVVWSIVTRRAIRVRHPVRGIGSEVKAMILHNDNIPALHGRLHPIILILGDTHEAD